MATVRINEPTPNGGAYSIATYLDRNRKPVEIEDADIIIIGEYDEDDNLIRETVGFTEKGMK